MGDDKKNDDERSAAGTWLRRARRAKQAHDWYGRFNWLTSLFKTKAEIAMAIGSAGVVGTVAGMTTFDAIESKRLAAEQPTLVETERTTESSTVFTIEGHDKAGRRALFDVVVAKKEFLWVRGSSDEIEKEGRVLKGADIGKELFDAEVSAALAGARAIIAVGTASQEGSPEEERARAGRRALRAASLASEAVAADMPISALNLGQYREPCAACETSGTSWQRPFILIAAKEMEEGVNIGEALADALTGKSKLPSPESYSAFELTTVR